MRKLTCRAASLSVLAMLASMLTVVVAPASAVEIPLPTGSVRFDTCGQTGRYGPSEQQCRDAYAGQDTSPVASSLNFKDTFKVDRGYQYWTVPLTGSYSITIAGASSQPGLGAQFSTLTTLTRGQVLRVVIGQRGSCQSGGGCGGGGGTFVATSGNAPIAVAGGGGARASEWGDWAKERQCEANARFDSRGGRTREAWAWMCGSYNGYEGYNGNGGGSMWCGTGGGGFYGGGGSGCWEPFRGGQSFVAGAVGGWSQCGTSDGGFGGGGAGFGCGDGSAGGGGGYSGGGGADSGRSCWYYCAPRVSGGGGSFAASAMTDSGFNDGDGWVLITALSIEGVAPPVAPGAVRLGTSGQERATLSWVASDQYASSALDKYLVQVRQPNLTDWSASIEVSPDDSTFTFSTSCAERWQARIAAHNAAGTSPFIESEVVMPGTDSFQVCPSSPHVSLPGVAVTVPIAGSNPNAAAVLGSSSGAGQVLSTNADNISYLKVKPGAAGKTKVTATQTYLDKTRNRWVKQQAIGYIWTAGLRLPRSATAGRAVTVTASYVYPGETLTFTTDSMSVQGVADSRGNISVQVLFPSDGVRNLTVAWGNSLLSTSTVNVTKKR